MEKWYQMRRRGLSWGTYFYKSYAYIRRAAFCSIWHGMCQWFQRALFWDMYIAWNSFQRQLYLLSLLRRYNFVTFIYVGVRCSSSVLGFFKLAQFLFLKNNTKWPFTSSSSLPEHTLLSFLVLSYLSLRRKVISFISYANLNCNLSCYQKVDICK